MKFIIGLFLVMIGGVVLYGSAVVALVGLRGFVGFYIATGALASFVVGQYLLLTGKKK